MKEAKYNLWTFPAEYRCITTNGIVKNNGELVMGAGIALEAKRRFPKLPMKLGEYVDEFGNVPFVCFEENIITFPTKHHWKDPSDLDLIVSSAKLIVNRVNVYTIGSVALTRPGCGNGNMVWSEVKPLIEDILDNRFTVCSF